MALDPPQPGPDIGGSGREAVSYGFLPHKVTARLREMIRARVAARTVRAVDRDFDARKALDDLRRKKKPVRTSRDRKR
jgi:hypothetical protein